MGHDSSLRPLRAQLECTRQSWELAASKRHCLGIKSRLPLMRRAGNAWASVFAELGVDAKAQRTAWQFCRRKLYQSLLNAGSHWATCCWILPGSCSAVRRCFPFPQLLPLALAVGCFWERSYLWFEYKLFLVIYIFHEIREKLQLNSCILFCLKKKKKLVSIGSLILRLLIWSIFRKIFLILYFSWVYFLLGLGGDCLF